jgi:hypothetical protein
MARRSAEKKPDVVIHVELNRLSLDQAPRQGPGKRSRPSKVEEISDPTSHSNESTKRLSRATKTCCKRVDMAGLPCRSDALLLRVGTIRCRFPFVANQHQDEPGDPGKDEHAEQDDVSTVNLRRKFAVRHRFLCMDKKREQGKYKSESSSESWLHGPLHKYRQRKKSILGRMAPEVSGGVTAREPTSTSVLQDLAQSLRDALNA